MNSETASGLSYTAGVSATFLGLTIDEWGIIGVVIGIISVVMTYVTNIWFRRQHLELAREKRREL